MWLRQPALPKFLRIPLSSVLLPAVLWLLSATTLELFSGCRHAEQSQPVMNYDSNNSQQSNTLIGNTNMINTQMLYRYVGRFSSLNDANSLTAPQNLNFAWPGTSVGAVFSGNALTINMSQNEALMIGNQPSYAIVQITVDNLPALTVQLSNGVTSYNVAENITLTSGTHTVWLRKQTEAFTGTLSFSGFNVGSGQLLGAPSAKAHRLEVIGASNECGYGDLAEVTAANMCTFSPQTESVLVAYPFLVAANLNADVGVIAYSGKGIYQNQDGVVGDATMSNLYSMIDPSASTTDPNNLWAFNQQIPDVVVIDLGGNDFDATTPPPQDGFVNAYTSFLKMVRGNYPNALIFCVVGPTVFGDNRTTLISYQQQAISNVNDLAIFYLPFDVYTGSNYGCDYHPDQALHQAMAQQLTAAIQQHVNW